MSDITIEGTPTEVHRDTPVDVIAEIVPVTDEVEPRPARSLAIRRVLERQLGAGQDLSADLLDAATDATAAVAHAPITYVTEIGGGADLPTALARTGSTARASVTEVGERVRGVVGGYVGAQAVLPNAILSSTADVVETVLRAQGALATTAVTATFALATAAVSGGDVDDTLTRGRADVRTAADEARSRIGASVDRAGDDIRSAIRDYDDVIAS